MQHWSGATRAWLSSLWLPTLRGPSDAVPTVGSRSAKQRRNRIRLLARGASTRVEYLIRPARITDIERLVALGGAAGRASTAGPLDSGDLLRQLVYLPQASIFVAEARRDVVGGAVLALRPSVVAGGYAGTVDLLVVDPDHDVDRVTDALLDEVIRSAQNKGCSVIEAPQPTDPAARTRWERHGFVESGPRTELHVAAVGAGTSRSR